MKGIIFVVLLIVGLITINRVTVSSETYVNRVGELEMPSMLGAWLMIGYVCLLFVLFRDRDGNIGAKDFSDLELGTTEEANSPGNDDITDSHHVTTSNVETNGTRFHPTDCCEFIDNQLVKQGDPKRYIEIQSLGRDRIEIFIQFNFRQKTSLIKELGPFKHLYIGDDNNYEFIIEYIPYGDLIESFSVFIKNKKMKFVFN